MAAEQSFDDEDLESDFSEAAIQQPGELEELVFAREAELGEPDDLSTDDLEEAYLKALEAMESAEWAVTDEVPEVDDAGEQGSMPVEQPAALAPVGVEIAETDFLGGSPAATPVASAAADTETPRGPLPNDAARSKPSSPPIARDQAVVIKPLRVIEACLFVGGQPLSAKKLAGLLDGNNEASDIETLIDELNLEYGAQGRPYEIRLGDGGYKLTLRAEFEAIRSRVYGVGPRDVKLSQDVLEVLALIAYQQPIAQSAVEATKPNSANVLRQLLRRELISLNRIDQSRHGVEYTTTPRFLQLFGLAHLNELPRPEDMSIR